MKKRFTAMVLSLCLILALLPATVFAQTAAPEEEASPPITVGGVDLESTAANPVAYAITDESGNVATEGANDTNYNVKWDGETLTLRNATVIPSSLSGNDKTASIRREGPYNLYLEGTNIVGDENISMGIMALTDFNFDNLSEQESPDNFDALTISGDGTLTVTGTNVGIGTTGNITIKSGNITATGIGDNTSSDMCFGIGTLEMGNVFIDGGNVTAKCGQAAFLSAGICAMGFFLEDGQLYGGTVQVSEGGVTATAASDIEISSGIYTMVYPAENSSDEDNPITYLNGTIAVSPAGNNSIEVFAGSSADDAAAIPGSPFDNSGDHDITEAVTGKAYFHSNTIKLIKPQPEEPQNPETPSAPETPADTTQSAPEAALQPGNTYSAGGSTYKATSANTVTLQSAAKKKTIKIPATVTVNGVKAKVTAIDKSAFKKAKKKLTKVVIGANVTTIGKKAFAGCKKLKKITIKSKKLRSVGKKAFKGISKNAVIKVPKAKKKAYTKLLKNKGQARSVIIR